MPTRKQTPPKKEAPAQRLRDRVKELRRVPAAELQDNNRNWRTHPYAQRRAVAESLEEIGIADVLIAYESERNGGALTLIDGHLRHEDHDDVEWPTLILDVDDKEADRLLMTLDPLTGMAETDGEALLALLRDADHPDGPGMTDLLQQLAWSADPEADPFALEGLDDGPGPPEMALQAFEHYDYVLLLYRDALDWQRAKELFGLVDEGFTLRDGTTRKVGLGRVIDGKRLFDLLEKEEK